MLDSKVQNDKSDEAESVISMALELDLFEQCTYEKVREMDKLMTKRLLKDSNAAHLCL